MGLDLVLNEKLIEFELVAFLFDYLDVGFAEMVYTHLVLRQDVLLLLVQDLNRRLKPHDLVLS